LGGHPPLFLKEGRTEVVNLEKKITEFKIFAIDDFVPEYLF